MFTQEGVNIFRVVFPKGSAAIIRGNIGISSPSIHWFLKGGKVSFKTQLKIYTKALNVIENDIQQTYKIKQQCDRVLGFTTNQNIKEIENKK